MNKLYTEKGFINQKYIEELANKHGINFIIEIGARQVGKTYGVLDLMLRGQRHFILMRRTITESDFICNGINNPFVVHRDFDVTVKKDTKYTGAIFCADEYIGAVMALSAVAKVRGFAGELYTDLVFDEFIPESHVFKIKNEGDAFLNAVVTISGNREINDRPPLRVWLLANSNNLSSPILDALGVTEKIENMKNKDQELSILKERGIMLVLPKSDNLLTKRKQTALFRAIDKESEFAKMAYNNDFAYNDDENIKPVAIGEYVPIFQIGKITYFRHKSKNLFYVSDKPVRSLAAYPDTERGRKLLFNNHPNIKVRYIKGKTFFSSLTVKERFIKLLNS